MMQFTPFEALIFMLVLWGTFFGIFALAAFVQRCQTGDWFP